MWEISKKIPLKLESLILTLSAPQGKILKVLKFVIKYFVKLIKNYIFVSVLRFGRFIDTLYAALKTVNHSDKSIRFCVTLSKIAHSLYLLCDHYIWLGKHNFIQVNIVQWTQTSNKYWFLSIVLNLVRDVIELNKLINSMLKKKILNTLNRKVTPKDVFSGGAVQFVCDHKDLLIDTVKNSCDVLLPLSNLGLIRLSPGTIGVAGMLSSILSLYTICDQRAKLPYS